LALQFTPRVSDPRIREALALSIDRNAIHNVLLQRRGEVTGALLPQWISGYAFLFPTPVDLAKARSLVAELTPPARALALSYDDPAFRNIAERIAVNARDAGLAISVGLRNAAADLRLVEVRIASADPSRALAQLSVALALPEPPADALGSPEELVNAERGLLEGFRVIPLLHLPVVYGVAPRVKGGVGISPLGEWRFENLWIEESRP